MAFRQDSDVSGVPGPDFLCFGMQKAGTRWLYDQLANADKVWMPPIKELSYFAGQQYKNSGLLRLMQHNRKLEKGVETTFEDRKFFELYEAGMDRSVSDEWYVSLFTPKNDLIAGDISPVYSTLPLASIQKLRNFLPHLKTVFLIRHPVDRILSALNMHVNCGKLPAVDLQSPDAILRRVSRATYRRRSYPTRIWSNWVSVFPENDIRFWFFEDVVSRPRAVINEIGEFLGVPKISISIRPDYNRKEDYPKHAIHEDVITKLYVHFGEEIERAGQCFGGPASNWKRM